MARELEEKNKALVLRAFDTLFNRRDYAAAERFWSPQYIQHSAHIAPGREGLFDLIRSLPPTLKYEAGTIVSDGAFVMVHGRFSGFGAPVNWIAADILRIENGLLVEHWDVIQDEATEEQSKSGAPMFPLGPSPKSIDKLFNINVRGTLFTVQMALPFLRDGGSIILNGSVASVKGTASFGVYAAKAAIRSFVRTWTTDLKDRPIRSNVISPGPINTPLENRQSTDVIARIVSTIAMGGMGEPEECSGHVHLHINKRVIGIRASRCRTGGTNTRSNATALLVYGDAQRGNTLPVIFCRGGDARGVRRRDQTL